MGNVLFEENLRLIIDWPQILQVRKPKQRHLCFSFDTNFTHQSFFVRSRLSNDRRAARPRGSLNILKCVLLLLPFKMEVILERNIRLKALIDAGEDQSDPYCCISVYWTFFTKSRIDKKNNLQRMKSAKHPGGREWKRRKEDEGEEDREGVQIKHTTNTHFCLVIKAKRRSEKS